MSVATQFSPVSDLRSRILGIDQLAPLLDGRQAPYVNLDNAASTPPFVDVMAALERFMPLYSSVHRGTGFKSRLSTVAYDEAHEIIAQFVGADLAHDTVIFGKNSTEALNKLSFRLNLGPDDVVITTQLEHHSNDLPWRARGRVLHVRAKPNGEFDEAHFDELVAGYAGRIALVAVTGASNVSGYIQPYHRLARKAHAAGARILVDTAQLAPHRRVDMKANDDPEHLDFVVLSAHKMYAPFGTGALVGPRDFFMAAAPEYTGGGTVDLVTADEVYWAGMPDRDEAGSPNVVGAVAMAVAAQVLMSVGMEAIAAHEADLVAYALEKMGAIPGIQIYGERDPARAATKVGVIPFTMAGISHFKVASILGYEGGIGVRSGCFCAQPYVVHLLGLSPNEALASRDRILANDRVDMPGMVRASFGCYNNRDDIDRLVSVLQTVADGSYEGEYEVDPVSGEYMPEGYRDAFSPYFRLQAN